MAAAITTIAVGSQAGILLTNIHSFNVYTNGETPYSGVIQGSDGYFYGTTFIGGTNGNHGTVFKISSAGALTTLYSFTGGNDGGNPISRLVQASDGYFYGTTAQGANGLGTVFRISASGMLTTVYSFTGGSDGGSPFGGLIQTSDGNLYGTTENGGITSGAGTIFKITTGGVLTTLYSFTGTVANDGGNPEAAMIQGSDGNFYGTAYADGSNDTGTVFKISPGGAFTSLHVFTGGDDGGNPAGALVQGSDGNFYGTTDYGGTNGYGTVFKISSSGVLTSLYSFTGGMDGSEPAAGLVIGSDGNFYGETYGGGVNNNGTVFQMTTNGVLTNLYSFAGGNDGTGPYGGALVQGSDGFFYGTTLYAGTNNAGTVFKVSVGGAHTNLTSFSGATDGLEPGAPLLQASDGTFYGTVFAGASNNFGDVFSINVSGVFANVYSFTSQTNGEDNYGGLVQGSDGNFYGTTAYGGTNGSGTVFKLSPSGVFTNIYYFTGLMDGAIPYGGLVQGSDANFYGATLNGGTNGLGTVYKISPGGTLTTLYSFTGGNDGSYPQARLILASDGNFYGATLQGGTSALGTLYKISPSGTLTTLYAFTSATDGEDVEGGLVQGSDGNFYGTTYAGGANGFGTVFKLSSGGTFTSLYSFTGGSDGGYPYVGLVQGSDGNLYGTTTQAGASNAGTVFEISPGGAFTSLYSFTGGIDGAYPYAALIQSSDGAFYGTAQGGGRGGQGVVFRFSPGCLQVQCPTNKTVACGTVWTFDQPVANSCCTNEFSTSTGLTNVLITPLSTVTNGVCPTVTVTRTWSIVDGCGDTNTCSQVVTVTGCCTNCNNQCCGANLGPETIQWLQCPAPSLNVQALLADPSGDNGQGTWIITNLPCYGNVLITQTFPDNSPDQMLWFLNTNLQNLPGIYGNFVDSQAGYGPYSWGTYGSVLNFINDQNTNITYDVNFYFLDNAPKPCTTYLGVVGLGENTTATVSQPVIFRTEYDLPGGTPGGDGFASSETTLNGVYGPPVAGTTGTGVGSAYYDFNYDIANPNADKLNTGWAVLQPTSALLTTNLPPGSGTDINGNTYPAAGTTCSYLTLKVNHMPGDGIGFTVGYVCCTNCATNCLEIACSNIVVSSCSNVAVTYSPIVTDPCCTNWTAVCTPPSGTTFAPNTTNNVTCVVTDSCGNTDSCTFTVTVLCNDCCVGCAPPYPSSYSVTVYPGTNYLSDNLCQGTNNTLAQIVPTVPNGTTLWFWNEATQSYNTVAYGRAGWSSPNATLSPGQGFILVNPSSTNYVLTISGCLPNCPLPCQPPLGFSLVGGTGTNPIVSWSNLFTCPPPCGTSITLFNPTNQQSATYVYGGGVWTPSLPVPLLGVGQSAALNSGTNTGLTVSCPTNKTVACGTAWTFDQPVATTCCTNQIAGSGVPTNLLITPLSTVTNGVCPQVTITQTWAITDGCGDSNTCSQVVTVTGCCTNTNNCILLNCPSNIVVTSCTNIPVYYNPMATDSCCSNLNVACTPPSGSSFAPNTTNTITCVASDGCGNSNTCSFTVTVLCNPCACNGQGGTGSAVFNTILNFGGSTGSVNPYSGVVISPDNLTLYGTATAGDRALFSLGINLGNYTELYAFDTATKGDLSTEGDGAGAVTLSSDGKTLYGTADRGGTFGWGTIWSIDLGTGILTDLYNFTGVGDGGNPVGTMALSADGHTLYGTTFQGGSSTGSTYNSWGSGTVFAFNVQNGTLTTLYNFSPLAGNLSNGDGAYPWTGVTLSSDQTTIYGVASAGGTYTSGTMFSINVNNSQFTLLHTFSQYQPSLPGNSDGIAPFCQLLLSADGSTLYGDTQMGGAYNQGTLFSFNLNTAQLTTLYNFSAVTGSGPFYVNADGANPQCNLIFSPDGGTFYGTAFNGGTSGGGTIFAFNLASQVFTTLHSFGDPHDFDGTAAFPGGALAITSDGHTLYGTTTDGGTNGVPSGGADGGTIFALTLANSSTNCFQVQCPSNIVVTSCTNVQEFYSPTVTDHACSNWNVVCMPPSGTFFAPNTTNTVTCVVTDCCSNSNSCSFTVTVLQGTNCNTNCCTNCAAPYPDSYTITILTGTNYIADDLCQGTNNLLEDLVTNVPNGTRVEFWNQTSQSFTLDSFARNRWLNGTEPLTPGEGFILVNPGTNFTLTISGCLPGCPLPCQPPPGMSLLGGGGTNVVNSWSDLFSCPPSCGTTIAVFDATNQQATMYVYGNGVWVPPLPVPLLGVGQSAFVTAGTNSGLTVSCSTNKTVACGTSWTFDQPLASTCCTNSIAGSGVLTNILITPVSTVTNGACPQLTITQTWAIIDGCGDSNTCSQVVTVTGCCTNTNSCILLNCPSNIVVTTCSNCVPVFYSATATNTCCHSNVVINYSIPSGSCFSLGTTTVYVAAVDPDCASTPPATCSFTVTVNQGTNCCSGPGMGLQSIQWLQLPTNTTRLLPNPTGANGGGTWIITNLPGYGNVLVVQEAPTNVVVRCTNSDFGRIHAAGSFDSPPTSYGFFNFTEAGYGPYTWGVLPGSVEMAYGFPYTRSNNLPPYQVSFYFLDGQPNPGSLVFATIGLSKFTTNTLSQPFTFRTEYDLLYDPVNYPQGPSADTVLDGTYGSPLITGVTGTVISSAYVFNGGDDYNTGYAILQPTNYLQTATLPPGSGFDINLNPYPSLTNACPYLTVTVNHYIYDIFSMTVGYLCCTNCPTNCLVVQGTTNKTVVCGTQWTFDTPTATSCCTNEFQNPDGTATNVLITPLGAVTNGSCPDPFAVTQTWSIVDACGNSNTWSQTVFIVGCCTNCFHVQCPTNKTVPCGSAWTFDTPTATTCCTNYIENPDGTLTNLIILPMGTVTNGSCPQVFVTQTWLISDACGNRTNCSQTVIVTGCCTNCLQVDCPTNKTVQCGTGWTFDLPIATSCCPSNFSGTQTNIQITLTGTVTNGVCPQLITASWQITDACGNSTNCSQTVTVQNTNSPVVIPGIVLDYATVPDAGISFAGGGFTFVGAGNGDQFEIDNVFNGAGDSVGFNGFFSSSGPFTIGPITISGPLQTAPVTGSGTLHISDGIHQLIGTIQWVDITTLGTSGVLNLNGVVNLTGITYAGTSLDLQSLVTSGTGQVDLTFQFIPGQTLTQLSTTGGFTDFSGTIDGSGVTNTPALINCASNKTVACGTNWSFDPPVSASACCTNLTLTVISTVSNIVSDPCAVIYTRTWEATDCCSNTATCSQMVTVMGCCTNCLQVDCPTNKQVSCNSGWTFDLPSATTCCTNQFFIQTPAGDVLTNVSIVSQGVVTNGACPQLQLTQTWLITDGCSNTATCSQTVTVTNCCNNPPCLQVQCASNKLVACDSGWTFDLPVVISCCSNEYVSSTGVATNVMITLLNTVTNGNCPGQTITANWTITDKCGDTTNCSQTVTITNCCNPPCLQVTCPTNKSVPCGTYWTFDLPIVTTCCSNRVNRTNGTVLITPGIPVTNGTCPTVTVTQTWSIMDGCGDKTNCSQVVTISGCCTNNTNTGACCGPNAGPQTIQWLGLPSSPANALASNPSGSNSNGTWVIANLPCYGPVLITQNTLPNVEAGYFLNPAFNNAPNGNGLFEFTQFGYGPYNWGIVPGELSLYYNVQYTNNGVSALLPPYEVNFYFLAGQPDICSLDLAVIGLGELTTNTLSQPMTFRTEFDLTSTSPVSAYTEFSGDYQGALVAGVTGTVVTSAYDQTGSYGDWRNTGWAVFQPANILQTAPLPSGSGVGYPTSGTYPYLTVTINHQVGDGIGLTLGYICCTNCLTVGCPTNKTVSCGTAWTFDSPTATTCCPDGIVHVVSLGAVTNNGSCTKIATNIWAIYDDCGNSNRCQQVVTIVDTNAPVINCPSNAVIGFLNTNCQLVIPPIPVTATDNCTPVCSLVYSQSPTNGTVINGTNATVIVTVTDLCGNSSTCQVTVVGEPRVGPQVIWPVRLTATDCIVPCASNLMTIHGCACEGNGITVTQTPPCGVVIGQGVASVTVTVTDCRGISVTKVIPLSITGTVSFIGSLTNTGIGPSATRLPNNTIDPYYFLGPVPTSPLPPGYVAPRSIVINNYPLWLGMDPSSEWIAPTTWRPVSADLANCPPGVYIYTNYFTLSAAFNPASASISGRWAADDGATMYINGFPTGNMLPVSSYNHWTPFTINTNIQTGLNTITFVVTNAAPSNSATGLRVEYQTATVCSNCAPPHIISITGAQTLQVGSSATLNVNVGGTPPYNYQWELNGNPIAGSTAPSLHIRPVNYNNAGLYSVVVSNPCGVVTGLVHVTVIKPFAWTNALWNAADITNPLGATFGPDLTLMGTNVNPGAVIGAGTSEDFDLPNPAGQIVNVMDVNTQGSAAIMMPAIVPAATGSANAYTLLMDVYQPGTSAGTPATLYMSDYVSNLNSGGQDGLSMTLDASNYVDLTGSIGGVPFGVVSTMPLASDVWNRLALVVNNPLNGNNVTLNSYLNGNNVISYTLCQCCTLQYNYNGLPILTNSSPAILSTPANAVLPNPELFVTDIQFHAIALDPGIIALSGSPDSGPVPTTDNLPLTAPTLSATSAGTTINLSWSGSGYVLQESSDLNSDVWTDSALPFTETQSGGDIVTSAAASPKTQGPKKFYRLVFRP